MRTGGPRNVGLDAVRSVAIALVLLSHGRHCLEFLDVPHFRWWWLSAGGVFGVELFFVLSGYLIGDLVLAEVWLAPAGRRGSALRGFLVRRWLRTLPLYYVIWAVQVAVEARTPGFHLNWRHLVFAQNFDPPSLEFFDVSWSLALEEWFYALVPLSGALVVLARGGSEVARKRALLVGLGLGALAALGARTAWAWSSPGTPWVLLRKAVFIRFDAFCLGVAVVLVRALYPALFARLASRRAAASGGLLLAGLVLAYARLGEKGLDASVWAKGPFFTLVALGVVGPLLHAQAAVRSGARLFGWVSRRTYGLYLVHTLFFWPLSRWAWGTRSGGWGVLALGAGLGVSVVVAGAAYAYFERPILRWRDTLSRGLTERAAIPSMPPNPGRDVPPPVMMKAQRSMKV